MPPTSSRGPTAARRHLVAACLSLAVLPCVAQESATDPPPAATFSEEQQVTSVDLRVGFDLNRFNKWASGGDGAGPRLDPEDLMLRLRGRDVEVAAIDRSGSAALGTDDIGWQVLIYFDAALNHPIGIRWAAEQLSQHAEMLVDLGSVEIVVADPDPRQRLEATRDIQRVVDALLKVGSFDATDDDLLLGLRQEFVSVSQSESAEAVAELAPFFAAAETDIVLRQQDLLLDHLLRSQRLAAGRLLIYVSQGFDRDPADFYPLADAPQPGPSLADESRDWARSIAAYGWTVVPIEPVSERPLLVKGFRLGKWRFSFPWIRRDENGRLDPSTITFFGAAREADRDPELARSLAELAAVKRTQGDLEGAVEYYERAIHHFFHDPRTASEQARVWIELAGAHRQMGHMSRSRFAVENAVDLDPSLERELGEHLGTFVDQSAVLAELAEESGGHLAQSSKDLDLALRELSRRQRVTYQFRGLAIGELLALELTLRSDPERTIRYARWSRSGTPRRAADGRLRLYLSELADEPSQAASYTAVLHYGEALPRRRVSIDLPRTERSDHRRVLVGIAAPEQLATLWQLQPAETGGLETARWQAIVDPEKELEELEVAALYVEDLVTGEWRTDRLELHWGQVE